MLNCWAQVLWNISQICTEIDSVCVPAPARRAYLTPLRDWMIFQNPSTSDGGHSADVSGKTCTNLAPDAKHENSAVFESTDCSIRITPSTNQLLVFFVSRRCDTGRVCVWFDAAPRTPLLQMKWSIWGWLFFHHHQHIITITIFTIVLMLLLLHHCSLLIKVILVLWYFQSVLSTFYLLLYLNIWHVSIVDICCVSSSLIVCILFVVIIGIYISLYIAHGIYLLYLLSITIIIIFYHCSLSLFLSCFVIHVLRYYYYLFCHHVLLSSLFFYSYLSMYSMMIHCFHLQSIRFHYHLIARSIYCELWSPVIGNYRVLTSTHHLWLVLFLDFPWTSYYSWPLFIVSFWCFLLWCSSDSLATVTTLASLSGQGEHAK